MMKKVSVFLIVFVSVVALFSQGVLHRINWKVGYVSAYVVSIMLMGVALALFGYGVNRLVRRRRADL
ncbi:hypothetical protein [Ohtaekwangia koreensis]|jgi:hypothetical protein|uniref:Uncharacterized protein n=1 Tax=Ohtaekwangia koreensis TaxID=688867 RepID=A0A1T5MM30_9BACT|nr:hypothetical protein [Ohtaekwangia koreensis]SKC89275.1 hypothetical protein SAMN05660236_5808 [Ohtaekwangia koreensis]